MTTQEYIGELETLISDSDLDLDLDIFVDLDKTIKHLAKRAKQLETETLSEEDILDELLEVLPKKYVDQDDVFDIISQFTDIVLAEVEGDDSVEDEDE